MSATSPHWYYRTRTPAKGSPLFLFQALASGSSGNAFLLKTQKVSLLFDAGLRFTPLQRYLHAEGIKAGDLSGIFISHEHRDHCVAARDLAVAHDSPVWANDAVLRACGFHDMPGAQVLDVGIPTLFGDVEVTTFPVEHDAVCPVGFLIRVEGRTIAIATDLGHVSPEVAGAVELADLVVIEANHDLQMLQEGRYPHHLRKRVAGPRGHLSNSQAAGILASNIKRDGVEVWLAHLSKENNTQALALRTVKGTLKSAGLGTLAVDVAQRDKPSRRWTGYGRPRQLSLFEAMEVAL